MRVKKLISFYKNQHYFTILFVHIFLSRWLNESFRHFCVSYVKIQENWFILVHFGSFYKIPFFYSLLWLIVQPVSWRWHHLPVPPHHQLPQADNWWENQRWQIHLIQLPLNEQRETTSLWSFPFVRDVFILITSHDCQNGFACISNGLISSFVSCIQLLTL